MLALGCVCVDCEGPQYTYHIYLSFYESGDGDGSTPIFIVKVGEW